MDVKYVLIYESADDVLEKAAQHAAAHRARWQQFVSAGTLFMIGPFADPLDGALAIFTAKGAAEAFAAGDPFVKHGVVSSWRVLEWMEALS